MPPMISTFRISEGFNTGLCTTTEILPFCMIIDQFRALSFDTLYLSVFEGSIVSVFFFELCLREWAIVPRSWIRILGYDSMIDLEVDNHILRHSTVRRISQICEHRQDILREDAIRDRCDLLESCKINLSGIYGFEVNRTS